MPYCNINKEDVSGLNSKELFNRCSHCLESRGDGSCPHLLESVPDEKSEEQETETLIVLTTKLDAAVGIIQI